MKDTSGSRERWHVLIIARVRYLSLTSRYLADFDEILSFALHNDNPKSKLRYSRPALTLRPQHHHFSLHCFHARYHATHCITNTVESVVPEVPARVTLMALPQRTRRTMRTANQPFAPTSITGVQRTIDWLRRPREPWTNNGTTWPQFCTTAADVDPHRHVDPCNLVVLLLGSNHRPLVITRLRSG